MADSRTLAIAGIGAVAIAGAVAFVATRGGEPAASKPGNINFVAGDQPEAEPSPKISDQPALTQPVSAPAPSPGAAAAPPGDVDDPLFNGMLLPPSKPGKLDFSNPRALHDAVRSQPRDPEWAPKAETSLKDRYTTIPFVGGSGNPVNVKCASTICEVSGVFGESTSMANVNVGMKQMQSADFRQSLDPRNFKPPVAMIFGGTKTGASTFVAYITRPDS